MGERPTRCRHCKRGAHAFTRPWGSATVPHGMGRRGRGATIRKSGDLVRWAVTFPRRVRTPKGVKMALPVFLALVLALAPPADAGSLSGRVLDPSGRPVPGATVLVDGPMGVRTTTTDAEGRFTVGDLADASYRVLVESPGFAAPARTVRTGAGTAPSTCNCTSRRTPKRWSSPRLPCHFPALNRPRRPRWWPPTSSRHGNWKTSRTPCGRRPALPWAATAAVAR